MTRFERVIYPDANGVRRTVLLRDVQDTGRAVIGMEVDREGELVEPSAADLREAGAETGTRQHIILYSPGDRITRKPLVECWLTGRLVATGKADQQTKPRTVRTPHPSPHRRHHVTTSTYTQHPTLTLAPLGTYSAVEQALHLVYDHGYNAEYLMERDDDGGLLRVDSTDEQAVAYFAAHCQEVRDAWHCPDHDEYPDPESGGFPALDAQEGNGKLGTRTDNRHVHAVIS